MALPSETFLKRAWNFCNEQGNVLGMMPHPERAMEELLGSTDGRSFFASIIKNFGKELSQ